MNISGGDVLVIVGGLLQVGGVSLLVFDVVTSFRRLKGYKHRARTVYLSGAVSLATSLSATLTGGHEPTVEERVGLLERDVQSLQDELQQASSRLTDEARKAAEDAADRASMSAKERFEALEGALLGDTSRDKTRRLISIGAVVLGIILATVGSVAH